MNILFNYPEPDKNPNCFCPHAGAAFYCQTGHMLECHSGFTCREARCSHLPKYDEGMSGYTVQTAPGWLVIIKRGEKKGFPVPVYAPTGEMALAFVRNLIPHTQNLSKCQEELTFDVKPSDSAEIEKVQRQAKLWDRLQTAGLSSEFIEQHKKIIDWAAEYMNAMPLTITKMNNSLVYVTWVTDANEIEISLGQQPACRYLMREPRTATKRVIDLDGERIKEAFDWLMKGKK